MVAPETRKRKLSPVPLVRPNQLASLLVSTDKVPKPTRFSDSTVSAEAPPPVRRWNATLLPPAMLRAPMISGEASVPLLLFGPRTRRKAPFNVSGVASP